MIISLLFNCILIYWATEGSTQLPPNTLCNQISNDPNSPCNPDYLQKLIESNPPIHTKFQQNGIINNNQIISTNAKTKEKIPPINNNELTDNRDAIIGRNKLLSLKDLQITTAKAPPSNRMSFIADSNKRELSLSSPLSRSVAGDINKRANPNLYITESERDLWFNNRFFVFEKQKMAFCVMEKNSCSMFKQIFKRIRGKSDYLSTDYTKIHYLPYRGLEDISFNSMDKLKKVMNDNDFYFAAFVREPLERLVSGYIDKCQKKRGVNLCDYARWSPLFEPEYGKWTGSTSSFTPKFDIWADGLFHCPCWPETDWHFAPQFNFCNLYQYVDKFDIFRFENRTHRKVWMERAGIWDKFGKSGWSKGGSDGVSIVDFGPQHHSSTGGQEKYIDIYKSVNPDVLASIIDHYRNDYIIFGIQMAEWMCHKDIPINDNVKRALRTLPRTSRPPCDDHKWLWERE